MRKHASQRDRTTRGPTVRAPNATARDCRPRSAVTTTAPSPHAVICSTTSTIRSSPLPGASTTRTVSDDSTPRARPSTTSTTSGVASRCNATRRSSGAMESRSRLVAPARSRHHPSGTLPTQLAASTTTVVRTESVIVVHDAMPSRSRSTTSRLERVSVQSLTCQGRRPYPPPSHDDHSSSRPHSARSPEAVTAGRL